MLKNQLKFTNYANIDLLIFESDHLLTWKYLSSQYLTIPYYIRIAMAVMVTLSDTRFDIACKCYSLSIQFSTIVSYWSIYTDI